MTTEPTRTTIKDGKNLKEVALEYFPDADDKDIEDIIWGRTGYPSFWAFRDGETTVEDVFRRQLKNYKEALDNCPVDKHLCSLCNEIAVTQWHCQTHEDFFANVREENRGIKQGYSSGSGGSEAEAGVDGDIGGTDSQA